jgi:dTMP kinase
MRGILITFEGIDGCGKSTIVAEIARQIGRGEGPPFRGREFIFTAEPTDGEEGRLLRKRLKGPRTAESGGSGSVDAGGLDELEDLFLFLADHARHLRETVVPALTRGAVVVSDRYSDSRAAYQGAALRGVVPRPLEWVRALHSPWSVPPDKTILFSIDPALAFERCRSRRGTGRTYPEPPGPDKFEEEPFLREVAANFETMAKGEPERFVVIDAGRRRDEVLEDAMRALAQVLAQTGSQSQSQSAV